MVLLEMSKSPEQFLKHLQLTQEFQLYYSSIFDGLFSINLIKYSIPSKINHLDKYQLYYNQYHKMTQRMLLGLFEYSHLLYLLCLIKLILFS